MFATAGYYLGHYALNGHLSTRLKRYVCRTQVLNCILAHCSTPDTLHVRTHAADAGHSNQGELVCGVMWGPSPTWFARADGQLSVANHGWPVLLFRRPSTPLSRTHNPRPSFYVSRATHASVYDACFGLRSNSRTGSIIEAPRARAGCRPIGLYVSTSVSGLKYLLQKRYFQFFGRSYHCVIFPGFSPTPPRTGGGGLCTDCRRGSRRQAGGRKLPLFIQKR